MAGARHADVLFLMTRYLQARGLFASALALQQESGVDCCWLRGGCHELALLRRWVFAGDVARVRAFLQPLWRLEAVQGLTEVDRALQELQLLQSDEETDATRLAAAKLRCFERLVPLFRAPIDPQERDVFKYVAVSDLQLLRLLEDAVHFHRVSGNDTAIDCVSAVCGVHNDRQEEQEGLEGKQSSPLCLETPRACSEERLLPEAGDFARSADWTRRRSHRQNPLALSMAVGRGQRREEDGGAEDGPVEENVEERTTETVDVGVGCEAMEGWDVTTQTEQPQETDSECGGEEQDEDQSPAVNGDEEERQNVEFAVAGADIDDNQQEQEQEQEDHRESEPLTALKKAGSTSIAAELESSPAAVASEPLTAAREDEQQLEIQALDLTGSPEVEDVAVEDQVEQEAKENDSYCVADAGAVAPQRYDQLTLDHVVRARVVAEAKEPQAVRALDVHPDGGEIVIGTNARALRVFDLSNVLQQQQHMFASSSSPGFLPLLPVALERHKHSASAIYCVAFNRHVTSNSSGDVSMIASGAADGAIQLLTTRGKDGWKSPQVDELWLQRGDGSGVLGKTRALQFASPHLLWTATSGDRRLRCWDVRRASSRSSKSSGVCQTLDGHVGEVQTLAMPESATPSSVLLSSALDESIRLWDLRSSRCERLVASTKQSAFALRFHPTDETLVASGHQDGSVALWDLRSSSRRALQSVKPHEGECRAVSWSPDGRWLLSASFDGALCLLQASAEASKAMLQPVASFHQHEGKVLQAQWLASARPAFVSTGADKRVKLWGFA